MEKGPNRLSTKMLKSLGYCLFLTQNTGFFLLLKTHGNLTAPGFCSCCSLCLEKTVPNLHLVGVLSLRSWVNLQHISPNFNTFYHLKLGFFIYVLLVCLARTKAPQEQGLCVFCLPSYTLVPKTEPGTQQAHTHLSNEQMNSYMFLKLTHLGLVPSRRLPYREKEIKREKRMI